GTGSGARVGGGALTGPYGKRPTGRRTLLPRPAASAARDGARVHKHPKGALIRSFRASQAASGGKNQLLIINWLVVFDSRVDHRLQALEGHDAHLLARRLGLEHHLLAGERIDAF